VIYQNRQQSKKIVVLAVVGLAALALAACGTPAATAAPPVQQAGASEHVITVNGEGQASGVPDVAYISLGIDVANADVGQAISEANATMDDIRAAVLDQGVAEENIQTTQFNVYPEDRTEPQPELSTETQGVGRVYHVVNVLRVKVTEIDTIGDVIGAGLDAGANNVQNLSFGIDDPSGLEADARSAALEDAQGRAEQLAEGLGVTLGGPVQVSESWSGAPVAQRLTMAADVAESAPSISQGQLTVTVTVNVSYAIEQ
jgi:uncharacterized protein YggE